MNNKPGVSVGLILPLARMFSPLAVQTSNSGLRVFVYVQNAPSGTSVITLNTSQDYDMDKRVRIPASNFVVEFVFPEDIVAVSDEIAGCAFFMFD